MKSLQTTPHKWQMITFLQHNFCFYLNSSHIFIKENVYRNILLNFYTIQVKVNFRCVLSYVMIPFCLWVSFDYCRFIELDYTPMESGIMVSMRQSRGFLTPKSPERHCRSALHHPFSLVLLFSRSFLHFFCSLCHFVSMDLNSSTIARCPYKIQPFDFTGGLKLELHTCVTVKDDFMSVVCTMSPHQMALLSISACSAASLFLIIDS